MRRLVLPLLALFCLSPALVPGEGPVLRLRAGTVDPAEPPTVGGAFASAAATRVAPNPRLHYAQFSAPPTAADVRALQALGWRLLAYVPDNAYLALAPQGAAPAKPALAGLRALTPVAPQYRVAPELIQQFEAATAATAAEVVEVLIALTPDAEPARMASLVRTLGAEQWDIPGYRTEARIHARLPVESLPAAAAHDQVLWIERAPTYTTRNDFSAQVVQSGLVNVPGSTPIWDRGLHGEDEIVGHIDDLIDLDLCYFRDAARPDAGPDHRKVVGRRTFPGDIVFIHGNHTAGTIAGMPDNNPAREVYRGVAWAARLSHSSLGLIVGYSGGVSNPEANLDVYLEAASVDGARVHTNSWGDDNTTAYTWGTIDIDRYLIDREDELVLFAATNLANVLKVPENGKNLLSVVGSGRGPSTAPTLEARCSGGVGPTADGRRKPEIVAPGCQVESALPGGLTDCDVTPLSGNSMASPGVAGGIALIRQYYREGWYPSGSRTRTDEFIPSGALLKATAIASGRDMTAVSGYPSNAEGWGRLTLDDALYFSGESRRLWLHDARRDSDGLSTGGQRRYRLRVTDASIPLRAVLVWMDPAPAHGVTQAWVNNLDLVVDSPSGSTFVGNGFSGGVSSAAITTRDPRNNVEVVLLAAPALGVWDISVEAPFVDPAQTGGRQGYALVVTGGVQADAGNADGFLVY